MSEGGDSLVELTRMQREIVSGIVNRVYDERTITPREMVEALARLMQFPKLTHDEVYEALADQHRLIVAKVAERAFVAGMQEAREPGLRTDE
jgi:hypothetical protein